VKALMIWMWKASSITGEPRRGSDFSFITMSIYCTGAH
jgi:hypothetical protein